MKLIDADKLKMSFKPYFDGKKTIGQIIDEQPTVESQPNRCDSCTHSEEQDGSNCYECVKGMSDNFEAQSTDADYISDPCDGCRYELNSTNGNPCYSCGKYKLTEQQPSEEYILKFYYVESLDDYWIGKRIDTMYYAEWSFELQAFVWTYSRYLPWEKHVVKPNTLWKEYTYPSEPKEIPFTKWIKGFLKKYGESLEKIRNLPPVTPQRPNGEWIKVITDKDDFGETWHFKCSICGKKSNKGYRPLENYCPNCGAKMSGGGEE